jgi:K+-sensing histidine kinase KdpD
MMAITHELKTPIAVAKLNLETLQKHLLDEQKKKKIVQMTLQETERLDRLATNILLSAQLEGSSYVRSREDLDFSELVEKAISDFSRRYANREWTHSVQKNVEINGDPLLLTLLINNLLENAVKYSPVSAPVTCILSKNDHEVVFSVADEGPGIPEGERKNIFKKFYRIGDESTRKTKGTGLGLYLCKKIASDHNADIFMTPRRPNGSTFVVRFN